MPLTKIELIELVTKIASAEGTDEETANWMELVIKETGCPHVGEYIFYGESDFSPENVVEKALEYKPIQL